MFLRECRRVIRESGTAVHIFPTLRMAIESHLFIPFVHRLRSDRARIRLLKTLYAIGLKKGGATARREVSRDVRYLRDSTYYRTWKDVAMAARNEGFVCAPRRSMGYLVGQMALFMAQPASVGPSRTTIRDRCSVIIAERLFSVTLVLWATPTAELESRSN